ncbi:protein FAR1-RELATED SEQUENCE 5-like [Silene latifolia]|uniref:protein FAR1-RELATED SEQUENCE 5-like n=1 Tax=Silene latifolia TaxID=37657 RepID=UPI003D78086D
MGMVMLFFSFVSGIITVFVHLEINSFKKKHRHLHLYHKKTIIDHSRVNHGPTRAFRNVKEYVDGYENVGAQLVDFKNFGRDIKCFIGDRDAQLFVNYFEDKRDTTEGFYFAYEVDYGKCLVRAFWCDAESRRNYALFGDYITYDPTYSTNKYCMFFTPFTGVDHHKRSVTFASVLLFHEDEYSFTWVFQKFLDAMGQREPHYFQVEASAFICSLSVGGFTPPANGIELIGIADARTQKTCQVVYNSLTNDVECSCKLFNRKGIICRHIIWVYSGKQVHTLPDKYILMRWTKNAHKIPLYGPHGELIEDFDATDLRKMERVQVMVRVLHDHQCAQECVYEGHQ